MEQIVICGNRVELQEVQPVKTITTSAFIQSLRRTMGTVTPILPKQVVMYAAKGTEQFMLVEKGPGIETIKVKKGTSNSTEWANEYDICLPWVYMLLEFIGAGFSSLRIYFAKSRVMKTDEQLYYPPLPNLNKDCSVCLGGGFRYSIDGTMHAKVAKVMSYYFSSEFNSDLDDIHKTKMPKEIVEKQTRGKTLFDAWQAVTKEGADPCTLSWHKYRTLAQMIEEIIKEEVDEE